MKGNVNPPGAVALSVFEEELMVGQCFLDEMVHFKSCLSIRYVYVGGLAAKMLRMAHSAHSFVECLAAIAARDANHAEATAQRFENVFAK